MPEPSVSWSRQLLHPPLSLSLSLSLSAMSLAVYLVLIFSLVIPSQADYQLPDQSFISLLVTQNGLDFIKDLLITRAISSLTPLQLPQTEKDIKIPLAGEVHVVLSNITIYRIDVGSSNVKPGENGVAFVASQATCNLSMNWHYSYYTWLVPIFISDSGHASVQVEDMEIGLTVGLLNQEGSLKVSLLESGCYVKDISITLDGGESWLYQGVVNAFEAQIESAVENAIAKKLKEGVSKLNTFLQALPREISVDGVAFLNVTVVNNPVLSDTSLGIEINGLFTGSEKDVISLGNVFRPLVSCTDPSKMLGISLDEAVFNSASTLFFNAKFMHWTVNKAPDQSFLNTAGWRFIVPQLYKKYPNDDMELNISLSAPPAVQISEHNIDVTAYADLIIDVIDHGGVVPVACISLVLGASGSVKISGNNLAGSVKLDDFTMSLKWSKIGNFRMYLIQPVVWTAIETLFLPYANAHLAKGLPLPIIRGFTLRDAEITCSRSRIAVCSNVSFAEPPGFGRSVKIFNSSPFTRSLPM